MVALWIVLAVALLALVVGGVLVVGRARRRRAVGRPAAPTPPARPAAPTVPVVEAPPVAGPEVAEEAPPGEPLVEAAAPELRAGMGKTRGLLSGYWRSLRARSSIDAQTWDDIEEALLRADVGVATTGALLEDLQTRVRGGELSGADAVLAALREDLRSTLAGAGDVGLRFDPGSTNVWLFVGVNGVGKTTTIGKVARRQRAAGHSVLLAAGDTFRAAAAQQLETWGERIGVPVVRGAEGGDPSAVVFDAVQRAAARGNDLVLADTAGRLHTKVNLVEELKKIRRVAGREPGNVTEVLLVLDATTGQNGLAQARQFLDAVEVTGVVLTKLDGTAKGGIVVAIQRELGLPVKLVGVGEGPDDLIPFDPAAFVDALFA
ncbi:MAG TPA: signal recognition particle-docking protein FtsY [Acidimicrobiales bacterium]|nr:signal recognition particle-docking protein FtsY [Acidimicrobiales bacterium]